MPNNPFCHSKFLGYVSLVNPQYTKVHFPSSTLLSNYVHDGVAYSGGIVGNYVVIEGENFGFIGKLLEVDLPENERLKLSEKAFSTKDFHPAGKVELLMSFDLYDPEKIALGLDCFPAVGAKVYVCSSAFIQKYLVKFGDKKKITNPPLINLGVLTSDANSHLQVSQQALFGRHCVVIGTTGGGKSWTVKSLIEKALVNGTKIILLDSTGEYANHGLPNATDCVIGKNAYFHYCNLTPDDLFFLVKPSGRAQAPKLLDAVTSLKIVKLIKGGLPSEGIEINQTGNLVKQARPTKPINTFYYRNIQAIEEPKLNFDITKLEFQIQHECVFNNGDSFGNRSDQELQNCISMISRIKNIVHNPVFKKSFGVEKIEGASDLGKSLDDFISLNSGNLLRIGFEAVSFQSQYREILANSIASNLLARARNGDFRKNPIILVIDEAHQYLNKSVSDEYYGSQALDAFDQIAKECRKYGLFLCLATQMPRDIPAGTLSQIGTFIVHRLINYNDKEAIANACSSANRNALSFLPVLGEGEAILTGVDFPMPVTIKINKPHTPPDSETPMFKISAKMSKPTLLTIQHSCDIDKQEKQQL